MAWAIAILAVGAGAGGLLALGRWAKASTATAARPYLAMQLRYQPASVLAALALVGAAWWILELATPSGPAHFLRWGDLSAPVAGMGWLGVADGDSWATVGTTFLVIMTIVTAAVMWASVGRRHRLALGAALACLPIAVALSAVNALTEELIFRIVLAQALAPVANATAIAAASALLFGIPHYLGTPGRLAGVLMAGFMGWFLMLSVLQTGGLAWAWTIHFVLDIVIITVLLAVERPNAVPRPSPSPEEGP